MFWTEGRFSWPAIIMIAYSTIAVLATDLVWRLVNAPIIMIAAGGLAVLLAGNALIGLLGMRAGR